MPVPWDKLPPTCQVPRPLVIQRPPTTASSLANIRPAIPLQDPLPDLQSDSAMEDEIDGFNFASVDLGALASDGAMPGISPLNPRGATTGISPVITASGRLDLHHAYPRFGSGFTNTMHPSTFTLINQLDRLELNENSNSETIDSNDLISRGLSSHQSTNRTLHNITAGEQPTVSLNPPHRTRSPPEVRFDEVNISSITNDDKSDQCNNDGYSIWVQVDSEGDTPLLLAIIHKAIDQALHFIRSVPSPELLDHRNDLQQSALHLAVLTHQPAVVRALVVSGASLDIRDRHGNTALHLCCRQGDIDSAAALTTAIDVQERIPLPYYVPQRQIPQEMSVMNYDGESCLHVAAVSGHLAVVEYLLSTRHIQANPNISDGKSGRTILHYAVEARDVPLVLFLMARSDVKIDSRTFDGTTALAMAIGRHYMDIANLLITAGAKSELVHLSDSESDCDCAFMEEESS